MEINRFFYQAEFTKKNLSKRKELQKLQHLISQIIQTLLNVLHLYSSKELEINTTETDLFASFLVIYHLSTKPLDK